jgi:phage terminase large subunit-like protein
MPLYDLKKIGLDGSDPRMLFSWYSADFTTDPEFIQAEPELRANPSMGSWPEGRDYLEQQRRRLPSNKFKRLHLNLPTSSEASFVDAADWEACIDPEWKPPVSDPKLDLWVGLDIGIRHDGTALVGVTWDHQAKQVKVVSSQVFYPQPHEPLNIDGLVPFQIGKLRARYRLRGVYFDPWQALAIAHRLSQSGINMHECPQTTGFLTEITGNLLNLIRHRSLVVPPDQEEMRLTIIRAAVTETGRGVRIVKGSDDAKIDSLIALAMACWGAVTEGEVVEPSAMTFASPIITSKNRDTGQVTVFGAPQDPKVPSHYLKQNQGAEPWRNWVSSYGIRTPDKLY